MEKEEIIRNLIRDYENGVSIQELIEKYGMSQATIYRHLMKNKETKKLDEQYKDDKIKELLHRNRELEEEIRRLKERNETYYRLLQKISLQ